MNRGASTTGWERTSAWEMVWQGQEYGWPGIRKLVAAAVYLLLASWLWGTGIRMAHFPPPAKSISVFLAVISILLCLWAILLILRGFQITGLRRFIFILLVIFIANLAVRVLTIPDSRPLLTRTIGYAGDTVRWMWDTAFSWPKTLIQAPDEFLSAYTGQYRAPDIVPGFPTPEPDATPIQAFVLPAGSGSSAPALPASTRPVATQQPQPGATAPARATSDLTTPATVSTVEPVVPPVTTGIQISLLSPGTNAFVSRGEAEQFFSWEFAGSLAENQSFEIRFYKVGTPGFQAPFGWVKETGQTVNLNLLSGGGEYEWSVVVVQGLDGAWERDVAESSSWSLTWEG